MNNHRVITVLLACTALGASGGDRFEDLREFTQNAYRDRKPTVDPVPEIRPHQNFAYAAMDRADPFSTLNLKPTKVAAGGTFAPNPNRRKEPLEGYPLDSLKMVGTLIRNKEAWVIVHAPDGSVHRAQKGNYLGQNFGVITKVTEEKVDVKELIQGPTGGWIEREAALSATEQQQ